MSIYISLIIPAFNEEKRITASLQKAVGFFENKGCSFEIIVVDDASTDNTVRAVKEFNGDIKVLSLKQNLGKGAGVKTGMLAAKGKFRIFTDADFSTPVYETDRLLEHLDNGFDIAIGSRSLDRSMVKKHQPFYRETMGKIYNIFVQIFVFKGITDTQCGFKGFTAEAAEAVFSRQKINGFSFDVEILWIAQKLGFNIKQIPVEWYNDARSTVNPIFDSTKMFLELLKIKRLHKNESFK